MNADSILARLRADVPELPASAQEDGRAALLLAIEAERQRPASPRAATPTVAPRSRGRARVAAAAVAAAIAAATLTGVQILLPSRSDTAAAAILTRAGAAADLPAGTAPRPGQFLYIDVLHIAGRDSQEVSTWLPVSAGQTGLRRSRGFLGTMSGPLPAYDPAAGLRDAPYSVLAALPSEPTALLRALRGDPWVKQLVASGRTPDLAVWDLMRDLAEVLPPPQKAAMFRAAATIPGIRAVPHASDGAGRPGTAVGLDDPLLGSVQFVFDPVTYAFLGERIMAPGSTTVVQLSDTLRTVAVVDHAGDLPAS